MTIIKHEASTIIIVLRAAKYRRNTGYKRNTGCQENSFTEDNTVFFKKLQKSIPITLSDRKLYRLDFAELLTGPEELDVENRLPVYPEWVCHSTGDRIESESNEKIGHRDKQPVCDPHEADVHSYPQESHESKHRVPNQSADHISPMIPETDKWFESAPQRDRSPIKCDCQHVAESVRSTGQPSPSIEPHGDSREGQGRVHHEPDVCRVEGVPCGFRQGSLGQEVHQFDDRHQVCHLVRRDLQAQPKTYSPEASSVHLTASRPTGKVHRQDSCQVGSSEQGHAQESSGSIHGSPSGQRQLSCSRSDHGSVERGRRLRGGSMESGPRGQQPRTPPDAGSPSPDGECHGPGLGSSEQVRSSTFEPISLSVNDESPTLDVPGETQLLMNQAWEEFTFGSSCNYQSSVTSQDVGESIFQCGKNNWVAQEMWQFMAEQGVAEGSQKGRSIKSLLMEIYCSSDSQLVSQAHHQGFVADRHGLKQGDLRHRESRVRLYQRLLALQPRNVWVSPRCKAWCKWSTFNMSKSPELARKVIAARLEDQIHLLLCDAIFQFQSWRNKECHFHLEQPLGSHMIAQEELASIVDQLQCARCDMCVAGQLKHPETGEHLKKGTQVWTSSRLMLEVLNRLKCSHDHKHTPIEGSVRVRQQRVNLSQFTELYTHTFARRIIRCMVCGEVTREQSCVKEIEYPILTMDNIDPVSKRRRIEEKQNPPLAYQESVPSPQMTIDSVLQIAREEAPKVGKRWFLTGRLFDSVQTLFPEHRIQAVELCKGADRLRRPQSPVTKQSAPWRMSFGIHRHTGEMFREPQWEHWAQLSCRQQVRIGTPARLLVTVFASKIQENSNTDDNLEKIKSSKRVHEGIDVDDSSKRFKNEVPGESTDTPSEDRSTNLPASQHGEKFLQLSADQRQQLIRMHNNLGHPDSTVLGNVLRDQGWPQEAIEAIKDLKCSACFENQKPKIARPSHLSKAREFNELIMIDGVEWTCSSGNQFYFYHVLDSGTNFHIAFSSNSRDARSLIDLLGKHWISWAGPPQQIMADSAGEFCSEEFSRHLQSLDTKLHIIPGEAHWQMGKCERHGAILQNMLNKYQIDHPISHQEEFDQALIHMCNAKNSLSRHRGYSPEILVLGKSRHLPVSNSDDDMGSSSWFDNQPDQVGGMPVDSEIRQFQSNLDRRECARKAFISADVDQKIRRAYLQRSRPMRQSHEVGSWVMYWRNGKGNVPGQWSGPARVMLQDNQNTIWLSHSSRLFRCAPEHVRSLSTRETEDIIKPTDPFHEWPKQVGTGVFQYHDLRDTNISNGAENQPNPNSESPADILPNTGNDHPSELESQEGEQPDSEPGHQNSIPSEEVLDGSQVPIPQDSFSDEDESLFLTSNEPFDHWIIHNDQAIRIHAEPRMRMFCPTNVVDCPIPTENLENQRETWIKPIGQECIKVSDHWRENIKAHRNLPFAWTGISKFKIKATYQKKEKTKTEVETAKGCEFALNLEGWEIDKCCQQTHEQQVVFLASAAKRQKVEVKEKELSDEDKQLFVNAKHKEVSSWLSTETVRKITRNKIPESQILRSRWVLTWKPLDEIQVKHDSEGKTHKPKARLVILGFEDPHLETLARDSPTMGKDTRMLLLQFAASQKLPLRSFDIQTAFLRGSRQDGRILGMEPPEEMRAQMQLKPWECCELLKSAYGLVNAPLLWYEELKSALLARNFIISPLDPCLFVLPKQHEPGIHGALGIHVDDGLCAGDPQFNQAIQSLQEKYPFGSQHEKEFCFTGIQMKQSPDGSIELNQTKYIDDIPAIEIDRSRRQCGDLPVTTEEQQALRGLIGSIQYAASNTRPDLSAKLSLLQARITSACVKDLMEGNKLLHEAKANKHVSIQIKSIPIDDLRFVSFSDASFATRANSQSQKDCLIMAASKQIGEWQSSDASPLIWYSRKIARVVASTLASEAYALSGSVDLLTWVRVHWDWLTKPSSKWQHPEDCLAKCPEAYAVVDCKSLYDLIQKTTVPSCQEYRTMLEALIIKDRIKTGICIKWVHSAAQLADALTKSMDCSILRQFLKVGRVIIHDVDEVLKSRADRKAKKIWQSHVLDGYDPINPENTMG